jgi:hypothetical protein
VGEDPQAAGDGGTTTARQVRVPKGNHSMRVRTLRRFTAEPRAGPIGRGTMHEDEDEDETIW